MKSDAQNKEIHSHLRISVGLAIVLGLFASALGATSPTLEPQGVKAQWTFADGAGTSAGDSSGNSVTGTLMNGAAWTVGRIGTAVSLDGANDYVSLGSNLPVLQNVGGATLATWIKLSSLPASGAFREVISISVNSATSPTNMSRAALAIVGDGTAADVFAGGRSTDTEGQQTLTAPSANLTANTWHHIAARLDFAGDMIEIYVNGVLSAQAAVSFSAASTPNTTSNNASLGAQDSGDSNYFAGALDETAIYGRLLSATEIQALAGGQALQAHWKMDEGAGGTTADATANAYGGTLQNGLAWTTGQMGSGLSFDGVDDYVNLGSSLSLARNVNATTVTAWIKPGSTIPAGSYRELISLSVNSAGGPTNTSRIALALSGDGSGGDLFAGGRSTESEPQKNLTADVNLAPGAWAHVAGVIDFSGKKITLYLNGNQVATAAADFTDTHTPDTVSTNAALGAQDTGSGNFFHGAMDDVRVYSRPLCPCEIEFLALRDGLRARWPFDENAGTTAADASGNNVTGTLANGAAWAPGQVGTAVSLDGVNDHVSLGTNLDLLRKANAATLATWIKMSSLPANGAFRELISISVNSATTPTNMSRAALAVKGDGTGADLFAGGRSTDTEAQQTLTGDANLAIDTWYHVAAVLDYGGNAIRIYLNGTLVVSSGASFSQPATPDTASSNAVLGAQDSGDSNFFHGLLDETRVYCRALSAAEISDLALVAPPAAPTNLDATAGDTQVHLSWTGSAGATAYHIFRRQTGESYPLTSVTSVSTMTYSDMGLSNGTEYFYVVKAINAAGLGPASNEDSAIPTPGQVPAKPVLLTPSQTTNDNTPTVVGTADPNVAISVFFMQGATTVETLSTSADFLGNWNATASAKLDGAYTVRARASNAAGTSPDSDLITITIDTAGPTITSPQPPNGSSTTNATPTISALWSDSAPGSGVNPASALILLDNAPVSAAINATGFSITPSPLALGLHTVSALVNDLAGNPSSLLTWSFSVTATPADVTPPSISNLVPLNSSFTNDRTPQISALVVDTGGSGIRQSTVVMVLNGIIVPASVTFENQDRATVTFAVTVDLDEGGNVVSIDAADNATNQARTASSTFTVDVTPPAITFLAPLPGSVASSSTVPLDARVIDGLSGPNLGSITVFLNTADVTGLISKSLLDPQTAWIGGVLTAQSGANTVTITALDLAGNFVSLASSFTVPESGLIEVVLEVVSGGGQKIIVGQWDNDDLVVRAREVGTGMPVEGLMIDGKVVTGAGRLIEPKTGRPMTDAGGTARLGFMAGDVVGSNTIRLSAPSKFRRGTDPEGVQLGYSAPLGVVTVDISVEVQKPNIVSVSERFNIEAGNIPPEMLLTDPIPLFDFERPGDAYFSRISVLDREGQALKGIVVEPVLVDNDGKAIENPQSRGFFVPTRGLTDNTGTFAYAFVTNPQFSSSGITIIGRAQMRLLNALAAGRPVSRNVEFFIQSLAGTTLAITKGNGQIAEAGKETGRALEITVVNPPPSGQDPFAVVFTVENPAHGHLVEPPDTGTVDEARSTRNGEGKLIIAAILPAGNRASIKFMPKDVPGVKIITAGGKDFAIGDPETRFVRKQGSDFIELAGIRPVLAEAATEEHEFFVEQLRAIESSEAATVTLIAKDFQGKAISGIAGASGEVSLPVTLTKVAGSDSEPDSRASIFRSSSSQPMLAVATTADPDGVASPPAGHQNLAIPLDGNVGVEGEPAQDKAVGVIKREWVVHFVRDEAHKLKIDGTLAGADKFEWNFGAAGQRTVEKQAEIFVKYSTTAPNNMGPSGKTAEEAVVIHVDTDARRHVVEASVKLSKANKDLGTFQTRIPVANSKRKILAGADQLPSPVTAAYLAGLKLKDNKTFAEHIAGLALVNATDAGVTEFVKAFGGSPDNQAAANSQFGSTAADLNATRIVPGGAGCILEKSLFAFTWVSAEKNADYTLCTSSDIHGVLMLRGSLLWDVPELKVIMLHEVNQVKAASTWTNAANIDICAKAPLNMQRTLKGLGRPVRIHSSMAGKFENSLTDTTRITEDFVNSESLEAAFAVFAPNDLTFPGDVQFKGEGLGEVMVLGFNRSVQYLGKIPNSDNFVVTGPERQETIQHLQKLKSKLEAIPNFREVSSRLLAIPTE